MTTAPAGAIVWITGLPASGKSTLAERVRARRAAGARPCVVLDGDAVRAALVPPPGYDDAARDAFYETLGRLALLLAAQGHDVIVAATAHRRAYRDRVRAATARFVEVLVHASAADRAARDHKGLYAAARAGAAPNLPGAGAPYEAPVRPDVEADGGHDAAALERICALLAAER